MWELRIERMAEQEWKKWTSYSIDISLLPDYSECL